jgi:hypothetical protein
MPTCLVKVRPLQSIGAGVNGFAAGYFWHVGQ